MPSAVEVRALASLAVVIGLLGLFVWALRRGVLRVGRFASRSPIVVETAVALGDRRSLVIVAVDGRRLLLGLTPGGMLHVADLTPSPPDRSAS
jgi:flagellar protein FliO/FliZ